MNTVVPPEVSKVAVEVHGLSFEDDYATLGPEVEVALLDWYQTSYGEVTGTTSFEQPMVKAAAWAHEHAGDLIRDIADTARQDTLDKLRATLGEAYDNPDATRADVQGVIDEMWRDYPSWKADQIARTETAIAGNMGALSGYRDTGRDRVLVSDGGLGDSCAECEAANGQEWSLDEAESNPTEHPNCTRSFSPIVEPLEGETEGEGE